MQQKEGRKNWFVFYFVVVICNATEIRKNWAVLYYELQCSRTSKSKDYICQLDLLYTRSQVNVQPKSSIPIGAKVEISPKGFTLGVKAELEKTFSICPKLLINAELYGMVLAPRLKKGYHRIQEANLQPLGQM